MTTTRHAVILPVVLFILLLLGLLVARFAFRVSADLSSTQALVYKLQTRLAAEAGVERVKLLLRTDRLNMNRWYDNPDELHRMIVWTPDGDETVWGTNDELDEGTMAYRFSVVADDPADDLDFIRFGITDESSKLNLNVATESQLLTLVNAAVADDTEIDPQQIVDAILDWRDGDSVPRGSQADTEGEYYRSLDKPYRVRNGRFDTVEELLLVKGLTAQILYGEDVDRNGLLTRNEDDGDASFPPDNQDGRLNRGLYPYLTVSSYENNVSNDQRPRVYLFGQPTSFYGPLQQDFEDEPEVIDYLVAATRADARSRVAPPAPAQPIGILGKGGGKGGRQKRRMANPSGDAGRLGDKENPRRQSRLGEEPADENDAEPVINVDTGDGTDTESFDDGTDPQDVLEPETDASESAESDDGQGRPRSILSPASLLGDQAGQGQAAVGRGGRMIGNPLRPDHLAVLMDRLTVVPPGRGPIEGLININTAPPLVLRCIDGLTDSHIEAIVAKRAGLDSETKATTAWLLTEEVMDLETFERIAPQVTARGQQFSIEVLGYADHVGAVTRLQVIVDMVGPIPQTIYYRDLSGLGSRFPIRVEDEEQKQRAR